MRAILTAILLTIATQAAAECGNLCLSFWWMTATEAEVQAELAVADVMAREEGGKTPLHWAAQFGEPANIQALLAAGADVMARNKYGWTPLHDAAQFGNPANIQALLAAGADLMARDEYGSTPLHSAARFGRPANIQALLAAGADLMAPG